MGSEVDFEKAKQVAQQIVGDVGTCVHGAPSSLGAYRQPIDVAAPSVPASNHGPDDALILICCDQEDRTPISDCSLHFPPAYR